MIYVLGLLLLVLIIIFLVVRFDGQKENIIGTSIACCVLYGILTIVPICVSYFHVVAMTKHRATIEQHQQALSYYSQKAIRNFDETNGQFPITDLKYQNYQSKIAELTIGLRDAVSSYNSMLAGKKKLAKSPFFGWLISLPDDLAELKMADYL